MIVSCTSEKARGYQKNRTSNKMSRGISGRFRSFPLPRGFWYFNSDTAAIRPFRDLPTLAASSDLLDLRTTWLEVAVVCFKRCERRGSMLRDTLLVDRIKDSVICGSATCVTRFKGNEFEVVTKWHSSGTSFSKQGLQYFGIFVIVSDTLHCQIEINMSLT